MFELAILEALPSTQVGRVQSAVYFYCMHSEKFMQAVLINCRFSLPRLILDRSIMHGIIVLQVTFEFLLGAIGLVLLGVALVTYYIFKIWRYQQVHIHMHALSSPLSLSHAHTHSHSHTADASPIC